MSQTIRVKMCFCVCVCCIPQPTASPPSSQPLIYDAVWQYVHVCEQEAERGVGRRVLGLVYRVVWLGEREGKGDNAFVTGVCPLCYYLHV